MEKVPSAFRFPLLPTFPAVMSLRVVAVVRQSPFCFVRCLATALQWVWLEQRNVRALFFVRALFGLCSG